jgi:hypothetical protein
MLERDVQAPTEPRVFIEETAHAHRRLRRPVRTRRVIEDNREPPLPPRIPLRVAQHGNRRALGAEHNRDRRPPVPAVTRAHRHTPRALSRCGAERLQDLCSGPPADSPSAWPRSHNWHGRISPPTPSSANRHAPTRAHRTVPDATRARHTARRRVWSRYFTLPTASRTRSPQSGEQNFWCHTVGTYSTPHNSQNRGAEATHFAALAGHGRRHPNPQ